MTRRYPAYKASGVEWLGEVPEGWDVLPVYAVGFERSHSNRGMIEENLLSLSYGRIIEKDIEGLDGLLPESFETYQVVFPGDIVFRLTDLQNDKQSLRSALVDAKGIITSAYLALAPLKADSAFLSYLFRAYDQQKIFYSMGGGLRQSMKFDDVKRMPVLVPPLPEQRAIAGFLDRETAKIDALVAEQRRLIDLLREKRQAVISQAVTRGLNPKAPLKPSGTDWLGDVPEGWEVCEARRFVSILSGFAFPSTSFSVDDNDTPLLRGANVGVGELKWEETVYWKRAPDDGLGMFEVQAGDLVIGMDRPWISAGVRVAIVEEHDVPCLLLQRVASLRTDEGLNKEYLRLQLAGEAFIHHFLPDMTGVSVPHISPGQIGGFVIVAPPRDEQDRIVTFLTNATAKFDTLTATAQSAITLLQERRAALISAAVTGKIDVRGLVPELAGAA